MKRVTPAIVEPFLPGSQDFVDRPSSCNANTIHYLILILWRWHPVKKKPQDEGPHTYCNNEEKGSPD
jgi:hypothetical protein